MLHDAALLRTFIAVCDCGSFTKAASQVHLTQLAVSLDIKRLEDQLGTSLIVRQVLLQNPPPQDETLQSQAE